MFPTAFASFCSILERREGGKKPNVHLYILGGLQEKQYFPEDIMIVRLGHDSKA